MKNEKPPEPREYPDDGNTFSDGPDILFPVAKPEFELAGLVGHRIEIFIDGKRTASFSLTEKPQDVNGLVLVLKDIVGVLEAPDVPDPELFPEPLKL